MMCCMWGGGGDTTEKCPDQSITKSIMVEWKKGMWVARQNGGKLEDWGLGRWTGKNARNSERKMGETEL